MIRIVWLFSLVLGYSRLLWARFVLHQDLQTVLRCHLAAFAALGGVPRQILYDRMKTAVTGEDTEGHIVYKRALVDFAPSPRLPPEGLPAVPRQNQGQGGAAVPLSPRGLLPRPARSRTSTT